jgi:serralysin
MSTCLARKRSSQPRLIQPLTFAPERAAMADARWPNGATIKVGFLNRPDQYGQGLRQWVKWACFVWSCYANLKWDFVEGNDADVTVNFEAKLAPYGTYSSAIGNEAKEFIAAGQPSVHLVFDPSDADNDSQELQRVILHEIGHVLGLIHEHERADRPILWDQPAVYRYYRELTAGEWTWQEIHDQVIAPYMGALAGETDFDPLSIMMYPFPKGLAQYEDGTPFVTGWNHQLTPQDISLAGQMYPFPDT